MRPAGVLTTLRIARRDALRFKGRSSLVVAMVALPVLGLTALAVLLGTAHPSPRLAVTRQMGQAALQITAGSSVGSGIAGSGQGLLNPATIRRLLPPGSRVVTELAASVGVRVKAGTTYVGVDVFDYGDPIASGMVEQRSGHSPRAAGQVDISPVLASTEGLSVGSTLATVHPDRVWQIVGIALDPSSIRTSELWVPPGSAVFGSSPIGATSPGNTLLASLPTGADASAVAARLDSAGLTATTRSQALSATSASGSSGAAGVGVVWGGLATFEVVLLAGAAFAVGARRSRRELGLVATAGGDRRQMAFVVLGGGALLGLAAAVLGLALGVGAAAAATPYAEHLAGRLFGPLRASPAALVGIGLLGVVTGLAAAAFPALSASRVSPIEALSGRRGTVSTRRRVPVIGLGVLVIGALATGLGSHLQRTTTPDHKGALLSGPHLILAGTIVAELGFAICAPALVGLVGRLGRFLPLSPRLALRDASRHRGRTAPAVVAIMTVLAGTVAASVIFSSDVAAERAAYAPQIHRGQVLLSGLSVLGPGSAAQPDALASVARAFPGLSPVTLSETGCASGSCPLVSPQVANGVSPPKGTAEQQSPGLAVGGPALLDAIAGNEDRAAVAKLASGGAVVFDRAYLSGGRTRIILTPQGQTQAVAGPVAGASGASGASVSSSGAARSGSSSRTVVLAAVADPAPAATDYPIVLVSPATATRLGLSTIMQGTILAPAHLPAPPPSSRREQAAKAALERMGVPTYGLYVERGFHQAVSLILSLLLGVASAVSFGATAIATGLAASEGKADLGILAAVGASPRVRRTLVMSQAGTAALLGSLLGVLAGLLPAVAVIHARVGAPLRIPWLVVLAALLAVPAIAALAAGVFTRSRLPLTRRVG